jgi:hypothetical protein
VGKFGFGLVNGWEGSTVTYFVNGRANTVQLSDKTDQKILKALHAINHPSVTKVQDDSK